MPNTRSASSLKNFWRRFVKLFWTYYIPRDKILLLRIFRCTVNSTLAFIFTLIPAVRDRLGDQPSFLPLVSVIVHPGRRVSGHIKGVLNCLTGLVLGLCYSLLARVLAQLCLGDSWNKLSEAEQLSKNFTNYRAALAILAVFETFMLFGHGWFKSVNEHNFAIVFPLFLVVHFALLTSLDTGARAIAKAYTVPFYFGIALSLVVDFLLLPEFGSSYLGNVAVNAVNEIHKDINEIVNFFLSTIDDNKEPLYEQAPLPLAKLLGLKTSINKKIAEFQVILDECCFELSYSYVPPARLQDAISILKEFRSFLNSLINACQLEYILLGNGEATEDIDGLELGPDKNINKIDAAKLLTILKKSKIPIHKLHETMDDFLYKINIMLAYSFDVDLEKVYYCEMFGEHNRTKITEKKDFSKDTNFKQEIILLKNSLNEFETSFKNELLNAERESLHPSDEMFLLSSFLMNLKSIAVATIKLMKDTQLTFEYRIKQENKGWLRGKSIWFTFLKNFSSFKRWYLGNNDKLNEDTDIIGVYEGNSIGLKPEVVKARPKQQEDELLNQKAETYRGNNTEKRRVFPNLKSDVGLITRYLISVHSFILKNKKHAVFGTQVAVSLMLVSFPMFMPSARAWYNSYHGGWIGFVCILSMEESVGYTVWVTWLRGFGVIAGSVWALISYYAGGPHQGDPYLETIITIPGVVPGFYYLIGTPYGKAAIIQIISVYIVMLAAIVPAANRGSIAVNFAKRCLAVGYGGVAALLVQLLLFPLKARDQLSEEMSFVCGCISEIQLLLSAGMNSKEVGKGIDIERYRSIQKVVNAAKSGLGRGASYNSLTKHEPRLKGKSAKVQKIFTEIIYLQRQIVERLETMALLRRQTGGNIIDELNPVIYEYRRQVIGSFTSTLRALQEAFSNKIPLPQYLPSTRNAHKILIHRVRELVSSIQDEVFVKEQILSWNATSAAMEEVIEYLEQLIHLTKTVVGVNEFKYGFLSRPLYEDWATQAIVGFDDFLSEKNKKQPVLDNQSELSTNISTGNSSFGGDQVIGLFSGDYHLSRIQTHTPDLTEAMIYKTFRNRVNSIVSRSDIENLPSLTGLKTKDIESALVDHNDEDEDLPLALKMVISRSGKNKNSH
ncbi:hypothetical protein KAFR_0D00450 [Kazachstania africana CBS 2517]|uniref:Uncharacterized protein n=1 Tax=Kazachstania africana (strain ATCC 22294 / BCRC 22015 / CBS 2517 / CECT 1963 / NBRC 1671 / NRRL Y-8276) TaxID=1071382 RepID=H2ATJ2_KAZAF|nr:hypothetical protein KAFR_0D00450 [Kazachstania africana CBS 2517]CCF57692.1 hypothetical protein KAFR_0D00450 [Kazachstania africana CBS 2517]